LLFILTISGAFFLGWMTFAIPATLSLPRRIRPGLEKLKIDEAIEILKAKNLQVDLEIAQDVIDSTLVDISDRRTNYPFAH